MRLLFLTILLVLLGLVRTAPCTAQKPVLPQTAQTGAARSDPYTPHLPPRAYAYHRVNRVLLFLSIGWHIMGLWLFLRSGISAALRSRLERLLRISASGRANDSMRAPPLPLVALYYVAYTLALLLWQLPLGLADLAIEHRFGFSHQSIPGFLQDDLLSTAVGWSFIPVVWFGYRLYAWSPRRWWLWVWAAIVPLSFFVTVLYPVVISPLFNKYTLLSPGPLREKILALASKSGIPGAEVFVEDTSRRTAHVNAYVAGIGPSTRIVLNDTALKELPEDQLLAMMGHEMGHYVEHHVWINVGVSAVGSGLLLFLVATLLPRMAAAFVTRGEIRGLSDIAGLPLVMLFIYLLSLLGEPFSNAVSRTMEHRADVYGLRVTGLNDATARLMVGFAERDYSDPDPPLLLHLWFGTHPTIKERIALARHYRP